MLLTECVARLEKDFPQLTKIIFRGETTIVIPLEHLHALLSVCRQVLNFDYLLDISSLDHFGVEPRFEVVYELSSLSDLHHMRVRSAVSEDHLEVPSVTDLWGTAEWHEREVYDMMGIRFTDHPDLRRILMWEGYPYYPLRKDFPLEGKHSSVTDVAFTAPAPLEGGPFVTVPSDEETHRREPRARRPDISPAQTMSSHDEVAPI